MGLDRHKRVGLVECYLNGELVSSEPNFYTNNGMRQGFAGWLADEDVIIPDYIALGATNDPVASATLEQVSFEFSRGNISARSVNTTSHEVRLTAYYGIGAGNGVIRQIGLYDIDAHSEVINTIDSVTGWSVSSTSGVTLTADTVLFIDGTGSLKTVIEDSVTSFTLSNTALNSDLDSLNDLTSDNPLFKVWFRPSDITSFSDIMIEIGNDDSNKWIWTVTADQFANNTWSLIELDTSDNSSITGSPVFTSEIDLLSATVAMESGRTGDAQFNFDNFTAFVHDGILWNVAPANVHKTAGDVLNVVWILSLEEDS